MSIIRNSGRIARRNLVGAINSYCIANSNVLPEDYRRYVYSDLTDFVNIFVLGNRADSLRNHLNLGERGSIRDLLEDSQLREIELVEELIAREISENGLEPIQAAISVLNSRRARTLRVIR